MTGRDVNIRIEGLVQGVGYRAWLQRRANSRDLRGWARNRKDGSVEAVLIGPAELVDQVLEMSKSGPPAARVDHVAIRAAEPGELALVPKDESFTILADF